MYRRRRRRGNLRVIILKKNLRGNRQIKFLLIEIVFFRIIDSEPQSAATYRMSAIRDLTGGRKLRPRLSLKLQEVYDTFNQYPLGSALSLLPEISMKNAIIEFHSATCAVRENIGSFFITVCRHGNLEPSVKVR